ncbi:MAG: hypothetical protein ACRD3F_17460 [Acidobacteriaceae bacterium]
MPFFLREMEFTLYRKRYGRIGDPAPACAGWQDSMQFVNASSGVTPGLDGDGFLPARASKEPNQIGDGRGSRQFFFLNTFRRGGIQIDVT